MKPIRTLQKLKQLFMSHNVVRDWREFDHMSGLPQLEDLVFLGNPLEEQYSVNGTYKAEVMKRLLKLKKLDGYPLIRDVVDDEEDDVNGKR